MPQTGPDFEGTHVGQRLDAQRRIFVDHHARTAVAIHAERRPVKQAEADLGLQIDAPAQRMFQGILSIARQTGRL